MASGQASSLPCKLFLQSRPYSSQIQRAMSLPARATMMQALPSLNQHFPRQITSLSAVPIQSSQTRLRPSSVSDRPIHYRQMQASSTVSEQLVHSRRQPFSTAHSPDPSSHASSPASSIQPASQPALNWNEYLRLRRIRRFFNLGGSVAMGVTGLVGGAGVLATEDVGSIGQSMFGLDPLVTAGIFTTSCAGLGWLMGPLVGTSMFGLFYRRFRSQMRTKEALFFAKIKRYRVDPTSSSMRNPVPDYYGEKITSVAGYRRWLKDQRAFNKKKSSLA